MAHKKLWNAGWEFCELPLKEAAYRIPRQASFEQVDIPHDWMIYETHDLYREGIGWYRREFVWDGEDPEEEVILRFDGVYMDTAVFVNDHLAKEWKYGYSMFEAEVTPFLHVGKNTVYVRVVYQYLNTRWYSGAGIFRNVWQKTRKKTHILSDGIYITPVKLDEQNWKVEIDTELFVDLKQKEAAAWKNPEAVSGASDAHELLLRQTLLDAAGKVIAADTRTFVPDRAGERRISQCLEGIQNPELWGIENGNLYLVKTELYRDGKLLETEQQRIGFRTMEFDPDKGFLLNGKHIKMNGVCEHHDFGCLGAAFSASAMRRKLIKLREMGVNAIRTSHNMPASELMDLTDEMGFLVVSEAFDMWEKAKTPYDYARFFNDWYEKDVASWVRRDRNRASLVMWSIGNEIQDTLDAQRGPEITRQLYQAVRRDDYKAHAPITLGSNFMKWEAPALCAGLLDAVGYNYSEYLYRQQHEKHPKWVIYGSETASVLASRGVYHFPLERAVLTDEDEQCSALGNSVTGWGAQSYEACICDDRDMPCSLGQFIWSGFDYIGESTPYQTKNCYFGQLDTAGFPKDSFYIFQSAWTDYRKNPMVHVFPYWDFNEGQIVDVRVCSNAPKVELFVNGESRGKHAIDHAHGRELTGNWKIPYQKGEIRAVAYDENGRVIAEEVRRSFTDAVELYAEADKLQAPADGQELIFVEIGALDKAGNPVENANNRIYVEVDGAGRLLGLDNGDSADFDQYKGKSRRLFNGKLLAVIGTRQEAGEIQVRLSSPGLPEHVLRIDTVPAPNTEGVSCIEENKDRPLYAGGSKGKKLSAEQKGLQEEAGQSREIPVRKIELFHQGDKMLTGENPEAYVKARICPENATCRELEWRAMNDTGIDVNFVELSPERDGVRIKARGDGSFWLKCFARNGGFSVSVQSAYRFEISGIGKALLDPYEELPAGLGVYRNSRAGEGIEHGINFLGLDDTKEEGCIGFENIDFGNFGSDEITLPIFANTTDPVTFRIWDKNPAEEDAGLLADCFYFKPPQWMVFQPETYKLSRRLKGTAALYITTGDSFQLRGFYFSRQQKAFARLSGADCDRIYGDSYKRNGKNVEEIGNNVILEFEEMDFGEAGAKEVTLYCCPRQELNPIQIRFTGEDGNSIQVIEAAKSAAYGQQTFLLEPLRGKGKLEFVFLPGSRFDFGWFQMK